MSNLEFWHHHIGISVPDLDASINWYEDVLGFKLERRRLIESIPAEIAVLRNGPLHIELFFTPSAQPLPPERRVPDEDARTHGNKHGAFAVADVPAFAEELRSRGADIVWIKKFSNGGAACFIRDNAGNLLEFLQAPKFAETVGTL